MTRHARNYVFARSRWRMELNSLYNIIITVSLAAVTVVLALGLFNMMRGGDGNLSQKLMRWRVGLQFVAIVIVMGVLWIRK